MVRIFVAIALAAFTWTRVGAADDLIKIGYTAAPDFAGAYVSKEQGFFQKHGLAAELVQLPVNSVLPAALLSNSVQFGVVTPPVFLQALEGGIELVAIAGTTVTMKGGNRAGVVARAESKIGDAQGFVGKKVGVPGLNATLHILFRQWLLSKGVDPKQVTFVEVPIPVQADVLKGGTVDAVISVEPSISRMISSGIGVDVAGVDLFGDMPAGKTLGLYVAAKPWAAANKGIVDRFRSAIKEATAFALANPDQTRTDIGKYVRMPPQFLAAMVLPLPMEAGITPDHLRWWSDVLVGQKMIEKPINTEAAILQ